MNGVRKKLNVNTDTLVVADCADQFAIRRPVTRIHPVAVGAQCKKHVTIVGKVPELE